MKNRRMITIVAVCLWVLSASAQRKQIGDARTILKSGKDFAKAEQLMTDLLKDSANRDNKRIYEIWLQSVERQYAQVNEKFYMKQEQDTSHFYGLARRMYGIAVRLDSLDARPDKKGRVEPELRREVASQMMSVRPNLFSGGGYFLRKGMFQQAYDMFETYLDFSRQPLFTGYDFSVGADRRMAEAAYWATYSGFRMNQPVLTLRHRQLALCDSAKRDWTLQYVADSWYQLKDDSMYVSTLEKGFAEFPRSPYFFPRLMDYYTRMGSQDEALRVVDYALAADSLNQLYLYAKSNVLLQTERFAESLSYTDKLIALNQNHADAYYNGGTAYLNIALRMDPQRHKKQIRKMFQKALPYMEKYRQLAPAEKQKWGPALYRIYFNLNMGKQFDEIDKILKK